MSGWPGSGALAGGEGAATLRVWISGSAITVISVQRAHFLAHVRANKNSDEVEGECEREQDDDGGVKERARFFDVRRLSREDESVIAEFHELVGEPRRECGHE